MHQSAWPTTTELVGATHFDNADAFIDAVCDAIALVRRSKTEAKVSQKAAVENVVFTASQPQADAITSGWQDIANAGSVSAWSVTVADTSEIAAVVTLAPAE